RHTGGQPARGGRGGARAATGLTPFLCALPRTAPGSAEHPSPGGGGHASAASSTARRLAAAQRSEAEGELVDPPLSTRALSAVARRQPVPPTVGGTVGVGEAVGAVTVVVGALVVADADPPRSACAVRGYQQTSLKWAVAREDGALGSCPSSPLDIMDAGGVGA